MFSANGASIPYRWSYGGFLTVLALNYDAPSEDDSFCADSKSLSGEPKPCSGVLADDETQFAIDACRAPGQPSAAPSVSPTTDDTITVSLALSLTATTCSAPSTAQTTALKVVIATSLGAWESRRRTFVVSRSYHPPLAGV